MCEWLCLLLTCARRRLRTRAHPITFQGPLDLYSPFPPLFEKEVSIYVLIEYKIITSIYYTLGKYKGYYNYTYRV